MGTLIINNHTTEDMIGDLESLPAEDLRYLGHQAQRWVWCMRSNDVLVLPVEPAEDFLRYVAGVLGVDRSSWSVVAPPPGRFGVDLLLSDRLEEDGFVRGLRRLVHDRRIDQVLPFHFESAVARLVRLLGLERAAPGFDFIDQGGSLLLSSKATFRALAAGTGVPAAAGMVTSSRPAAEDWIWELLSSGRCAIVKQDLNAGGLGNEIVSPVEGVRGIGARHVEVPGSRAGLARYLSERWPWYTNGGRHRIVIEHYVPECVTIYVELTIGDRSIDVFGHGEMRMRPVNSGLVVPCPSARLPAFPGFLSASRRLCEPVQAMGYRGNVSVDGVVTPAGDILLTELNPRPGGSTHVHVIHERVVGADDRVVIEKRGCVIPRLGPVLERLADAGIAYDPGQRRGVLVTVPGNAGGVTGECCIAAESQEAAEEIERRLEELLVLAEA